MHALNFRNKFNLYRYKVATCCVLFVGFISTVKGQDGGGLNFGKVNLPAYDERWLHYGFLIAGHSSNYRLRYNDAFATADFDSLHSVITPGTAGFKLGFVVDVALYQFLSLRASPTVGFYENVLRYRYSNETTLTELKDATLVELPILLKYKSVRRRNNRMYILAGLSPVIEASGSKDENDTRERLETKNFNVNMELGFGTDIFYQYFKFAIELRYSRGLRNLLEKNVNQFSAPLNKLTVHNIGFFITFEGGPS